MKQGQRLLFKHRFVLRDKFWVLVVDRLGWQTMDRLRDLFEYRVVDQLGDPVRSGLRDWIEVGPRRVEQAINLLCGELRVGRIV